MAVELKAAGDAVDMDTDIARLLEMLHNSRQYFYRRVDTVSFGTRHTRQQSSEIYVKLPPDPWSFRSWVNARIRRTDSTVLLSVGLIGKGRLPDLRVRVGDSPATPLHGAEISAILAAAVHEGLETTVMQLIDDPSTADVAGIENIWATVSKFYYHRSLEVLTLPKQDAATALLRARTMTDRLHQIRHPGASSLAEAISSDELYWDSLERLCGTTHLLVEAPRSEFKPGALTRIELSYTEKWAATLRLANSLTPADLSLRTSTFDRIVKRLYGRGLARISERSRDDISEVAVGLANMLNKALATSLTWLMAKVGVVGVPMRLRTPNADHAQSYYLLLNLPEDVSCNRFYWSSREGFQPHIDHAVSTGMHWVSSAELPDAVEWPSEFAIAELQVRRTGELWVLAALALGLAVACGYFFRNPPLQQFVTATAAKLGTQRFIELETTRQLTVGLGAVLIGAPAAAITFFISRVSDLGSYLSKGLRLLCSVAAGSAVVAGFAMAALLPEDSGLYHASFFVASNLNLLAGLTAAACLMPRGTQYGLLTARRIAKSRPLCDIDGKPPRLARSGVPADSRYRQRRWAIAGAGISLVSLAVWNFVLTAPDDVEVLTRRSLPSFVGDAYRGGPTHQILSNSVRICGELLSAPVLLMSLLALSLVLALGLYRARSLGADELDRQGHERTAPAP